MPTQNCERTCSHSLTNEFGKTKKRDSDMSMPSLAQKSNLQAVSKATTTHSAQSVPLSKPLFVPYSRTAPASFTIPYVLLEANLLQSTPLGQERVSFMTKERLRNSLKAVCIESYKGRHFAYCADSVLDLLIVLRKPKPFSLLQELVFFVSSSSSPCSRWVQE